MAKQKIAINQWSGGLSDDEKFALVPNAFSFGQAIDFRHSPSVLKLHRKTTKESGSTVVSEVHDAVRVPDASIIYLAGGTEIYTRSDGSNGAAGTYALSTTDSSVIGVRDLDYNKDLDTVFAIDEKVIHTLYKASTSPTWAYNTYAQYTVVTNDVSGSNTALASSISEAAAATLSLVITKEPLYSVGFEVNAVGTGNWTVTMHDGANNVIATVTIANASMATSGFQDFTFSSPVRVKLGATYHFHITTSDATGSVVSTSSNNLATASYRYAAYRLINTGDYGHAALQLSNKTLICNEHYLAEAEWTVTFNPHRLVFPTDCVATGITIYNEYAVIACARKTSSDSLTGNTNGGYLFFWDGVSTTYNFALEVPVGVPWSVVANNNMLQWIAGGRLQRWAGGDIETVYELHGMDEFSAQSGGPNLDNYLRGARHGGTVNNEGLSLFGFPHTSANLNAKIGVYSYGSIKAGMPYVPGFDYIMSTGTVTPGFDTSTTPDTPVSGITMVKSFGTNLLIAWKDVSANVTSYGVDYVNSSSGAATTASYESLWIDHNNPEKEKTADIVTITTYTLPSGVIITPKIRYDRSASWDSGSGDELGIAGETEARMTVHQRYKEVMFGFDIASSSGNVPDIISANLEYDDNEEERV